MIGELEARSVTFYQGVQAGTHTVRVQWKTDSTDTTVAVFSRTLTVIAIPT